MKNNDFRLLIDHVCVIVGAANRRSIGYATAELFASHGAKIAILDIAVNESTQEELASALAESAGHPVPLVCIPCNIVDPAACDQAMEQVVAHFGGIDSLINCAGVVRSEGMLDIPSQDLAFMIDVNLKGTFHTCQSALTHFAKQKSGRIVNLASVAAQRGGGLVGGAMLGLGRALGETVAVYTVLNVVYQINWQTLFGAGGNVASLILLKFGEAGPYEVDALMAAGLILFILTLIVNALADLLINRFGSKGR